MKVLIYYKHDDSYWTLAFYLYIQSTLELLKKNNIGCEIIDNINKASNNDIIIIFACFQNIINKIKNKIIFINSEPLYVKKFKHLVNTFEKKNIICWIDYTNKNIELLKKSNDENKLILLNKFIYSDFNKTHFRNNISIKSVNPNKDIDVLLYGGVSDRRQNILTTLSKKKYKVVNTCQPFTKIYDYINRAKLVIVVHYYEEDLPVDYYRISPLVSNKIFFIHEDVQKEDQELKEGGIIFAKYNEFTNTCEKYLQMEQEERNNIASGIHDYFKTQNTFENSFPIDFIKTQRNE
jgi:hypothetical protein